jgi:predicted nucleotide-binding protein
LTSPSRGEVMINMSESELINRFVEPYLKGEMIVINGTTIDPNKLNRVIITSTETNLDDVIAKIKFEDEQDKSPYSIFKEGVKWRAVETGKVVTDKYINKPPGSNSIKHSNEKTNSKQKRLINNEVFVVHGPDIELKNDTELFLKSINLKPIVLHRQLDEGLTVIEKFEKHANVTYAIILLTPDDIGFPVSEIKKNEEKRLIEYRARQNVIFEFGFFVGRLTRKNVCCIYKEGVTVPSDLNGLIYKKVNKSVEEIGLFLMKEIKNAELPVRFE